MLKGFIISIESKFIDNGRYIIYFFIVFVVPWLVGHQNMNIGGKCFHLKATWSRDGNHMPGSLKKK